MSILQDRQAIRPLLRLDSAADAVAAHYVLSYDEKRVQLTVGRDDTGQVNGFVAVCRTGMDLFRPLAIVRATSPNAARIVLDRALVPARPYYVVAPLALTTVVNAVLDVHQRGINAIYEARRASFKPIVNVLVTGARDAYAENRPRFVVRSVSGDIVAESGLNWQSDEFAEVYVNVHPSAQGRGLGRAVVSACTSFLLQEGLRPLYMAELDNLAAVRLCQALGYADTGAREYACVGVRKT